MVREALICNQNVWFVSVVQVLASVSWQLRLHGTYGVDQEKVANIHLMKNFKDNIFIRWLVRKLCIRPFILQTQCTHWKTKAFFETRGRKELRVTKSNRKCTMSD